MSETIKKKIKLVVTIVIIALFGWFLVVNPMLIFHNNEKKLEQAAHRYFDLNSNELPTGERIKTVGLDTLYHQSFIEGDLFIPYTTKTCSITNSWVKVKRENDDYKYYTYLECGVLSSSIDHKGPEIKLNGDISIEVGKGAKYQELGVRSVVDDSDGKGNIDDVVIKSNVDTSKVGTYEVTYTAFDSLKNKTVVTREVKVVQRLYNTIKGVLKDSNNFIGNPDNNYLRLSNILFRVYGVDSNNNVIIVADEDVSNVNFSKIDKWIDEVFYKHLNDYTKKNIVEAKYCNMNVSLNNRDVNKCDSYTEKKKIYIPSVVNVNRAQAGDDNFMKPYTMSWVSNKENDNKAYVTRDMFFFEEKGQSFLSYNVNENYGVRPMMTISGTLKITGGLGTTASPYVFDDVKRAKSGSLVNTRYTGEYLYIDGTIYRILDAQKDGTTKVISDAPLGTYPDVAMCSANSNGKSIIYNPKNKRSIAYCINNDIYEYLDASHFVNHEIEVPVYNNKIIYGNEIKTNKFTVKFSAPNMYDMFSAQSRNNDVDKEYASYWLSNTTKKSMISGAIYDIGVPVNEELSNYEEFGVRVVGFLKSSMTITSGEGTYSSPYIVR